MCDLHLIGRVGIISYIVRPERMSIQFDIFGFPGMYRSDLLFDQPSKCVVRIKSLQKQLQ